MIKIGIAGYGNLGKGAELAVRQNPDMKLTAIFTRRSPGSIKPQDPTIPVKHISEAQDMKNDIDVLLLCGGSATDLPEQGPAFAGMFNTVDSFDTHARIPEYFNAVDSAARTGGKISVISAGWDPGLFSLSRMICQAMLPQGSDYTFWGRGVSQGHSDAIRRIKGVRGAVQYTIPVEDAVKRVRSGENPALTAREKHLRDCYVVADDGADKEAIAYEIRNMPNYFSDYDTSVTFISDEELKEKHSAMPHGGFVIRSGSTGDGSSHVMEFSLKLGSNPAFTSGVLVACARAAYRLGREGQTGARTMLDIAPAYYSPKAAAQLRGEVL